MADSPALLISPSPVGAVGRFQRHKRKERPGEQSRYGALPRTPCGARRERILLYLVSLLPKGKRGATQRRRMGPTVGIFTPHGRAAAPANGAFLLRLLGRQGSGGFLPFWGGPPARFGDFPAVESHAGEWGRSTPKLSASALRCKPPQAALGQDDAAPRENPHRRIIKTCLRT